MLYLSQLNNTNLRINELTNKMDRFADSYKLETTSNDSKLSPVDSEVRCSFSVMIFMCYCIIMCKL